MKKIVFVSLALLAFAGPAMADKAAYCQAYARDFSDQTATDKAMWQHKFQIALDACLAQGKQAAKAPAPKKPVVSKPIPKLEKPVVTESAPEPEKSAVAKPAPMQEKTAVAKPLSTKLVAGTPEWNSYCAQKYTSFIPKTGMYRSKTGVARKCLVTSDFKG